MRSAVAPGFTSALLVTAALTIVGARVLHVAGPLSDNDRSRWATAKALMDTGDFAIGKRVIIGDQFEDSGLQADPLWHSVDVVLDPATNRFLSSKNPLLPLLLAAQTDVLSAVTDWSFEKDRAAIVRAGLVTFSIAPIALFLIVVVVLVTRRATGTATAFLVGLAAFGTFVTSFAVGVNNHVPAAGACAVLCLCIVDAWRAPTTPVTPIWPFILGGLAAGTTAALEPPALFLVFATLVVLALKNRRHALTLALPAAALPFAGALAAGVAAFGHVVVELPHEWFHFAGSYWNNRQGIDVADRSILPYTFHFLFGHHGVFLLTPPFALFVVAGPRVFTSEARAVSARTLFVVVIAAVALMVVGRVLNQIAHVPAALAIAPVVIPGAALLLLPWGWWRTDDGFGALYRVAASTTLVVLGFYIAHTTNFGGVTMGPRWLIFMSPMWILGMVPVVEKLAGSGAGRALLVVLLGFAILSATPGEQNPWVHPWTYALNR